MISAVFCDFETFGTNRFVAVKCLSEPPFVVTIPIADLVNGKSTIESLHAQLTIKFKTDKITLRQVDKEYLSSQCKTSDLEEFYNNIIAQD